MDNNNAAQYLPLVQAMVDGKQIQWASDGKNWHDLDCTSFVDHYSKYRIKPEPRTAHQIFMDAAWPDTAPHNASQLSCRAQDGWQAVIDAVKSGELT